jgi:hypothetical protein
MIAKGALLVHVKMATRENIVIKVNGNMNVKIEKKVKIFIFFSIKELPCTLIQPCKNNGLCTDDFLGGYVCTCETGYVGTNCETRKISFQVP